MPTDINVSRLRRHTALRAGRAERRGNSETGTGNRQHEREWKRIVVTAYINLFVTFPVSISSNNVGKCSSVM